MRRLLIRPGAIGDFIVSLPALQRLRSEYTEVWCRSEVIPLVRFADQCCSLAGSGIDRIGLVEATDVLERLRAFDEIHSWYGINRPDFREAVRGIPFHFHAPLPTGSSCHATDFYLAQVADATGVKPYAVLHPFSGSPSKNWPMERWRILAALLEKRMPVEWCRGPEDILPNAVMIRDLEQLAQWLRGARVFIGNDSGISHLAAWVGAPTIALFGNTNPLVWAPRGWNVQVFRQDVTPEQIAEAVP